MSITLMVRFEAAQGKAAELLAFIREAGKFTAKAPGCEQFDLYQCEDHPGRLLLIERWVSREAHGTHFEKLRASSTGERLGQLLKGPPQREYFQQR